MNKKTTAAVAALNAIAEKYSIIEGDLAKMKRAIQTLKAASD